MSDRFIGYCALAFILLLVLGTVAGCTYRAVGVITHLTTDDRRPV